MKKYLLFAGMFSISYIVLQIVSGILLTMLYTPSVSVSMTSTLTSQVEFGSTSLIPHLVISLLALAMAMGITKRISRRQHTH
ncbi:MULTISPECIES: hypothetical protein [Paenibacillus]|uniref:Uncharacterized protein n=1 Tax=Paenibacillus campinasensis TaxID=66347 RepID=A0ABW9T8U8_9BACL|nr:MULTISPECIES: hypothetical protein [Paenibacillus]MUG68719.1 hypothetical protein [Paenibacillus campinasensis]PAK54886.1 hypothetical protein CHH75_05940 [Paenibacillus sp. 7541]